MTKQPDSIFRDNRLYVITEVAPVGERNVRVRFRLADGRAGSIVFDSSFDSPEMRDKLIRAYAGHVAVP